MTTPAFPLPKGRASYSDLLLVIGVVVILGTMVLTLTPLLIDSLVAVNIVIGVVLLLVSLYVGSPLEFSVFPSVLLITTLFRLAVSIATTKLILLDGHAGHIIDTFGRLVAGGNLVVGMVVFLIITVVQFIVIAKGAERVAEVSARFSLDAMPGKQLSIDSDLRSGLIDKDEARRKRRELELESKLHGSLDGAMKFVKGDAICGIVIIVINLLGGLVVGVMQQGLPIGQAMVKYSILTIGDGMVAQIPALLSAMAAGLIVTRATGDDRDRHLGDAIARQLAAKPRVLIVAGGLCLLFALVPGFPTWVFAVLGLLIGATGVVIERTMLSRLYKLDHLYGLLLTFGLALIVQGLFTNYYGSSGQPYRLPQEFSGAFNLGFMFLPKYRAWVILASLIVCLGTWFVIERTKLGSYLRAATENPALVQAFGINVPRMVTLTYGFGVGLAALAGVMAAPIYQVSPQMGANLIIVVFAVVVIGGMGSILGAILTGFGLGIVEGLTKVFYPEASNTVIFVIMVLVLLLKPQGLFGRER